MKYGADEVIEILRLVEHPTCGFTKETYRSNDLVPDGILRPAFHGSRPLGSVLYFLVTPDADLQLHRVVADQMYHYYYG
jgi:predicted cupin superfamily sugar epimerase